MAAWMKHALLSIIAAVTLVPAGAHAGPGPHTVVGFGITPSTAWAFANVTEPGPGGTLMINSSPFNVQCTGVTASHTAVIRALDSTNTRTIFVVINDLGGWNADQLGFAFALGTGPCGVDLTSAAMQSITGDFSVTP